MPDATCFAARATSGARTGQSQFGSLFQALVALIGGQEFRRSQSAEIAAIARHVSKPKTGTTKGTVKIDGARFALPNRILINARLTKAKTNSVASDVASAS